MLPVLPSLMSLPVDMAAEPAFVPLAIMPEPGDLADGPCVPEVAEVATVIVPAGMMMVEIGSEIVLRVPGDVAVERAVACRFRGTRREHNSYQR